MSKFTKDSELISIWADYIKKNPLTASPMKKRKENECAICNGTASKEQGHILEVCSYHMKNPNDPLPVPKQKPTLASLQKEVEVIKGFKDRFAFEFSTEVLKRIVRLEDELSHVKNEVSLLHSNIKKLTDAYVKVESPQPTKLFIPKKGDECWGIVADSSGVNSWFWANSEIDNSFLQAGNCFRTKEEAERELEKKKALWRIKKFIHENNMEYSPDWNSESRKYYIIWDQDKKGFITQHTTTRRQEALLPYFFSENIAISVKMTMEKELKILFDIND